MSDYIISNINEVGEALSPIFLHVSLSNSTMTAADRSNHSIDSDIPVIDYEGSGYKTDFWVEQGREYEDSTERLALQRLLPPTGKRIVEIGAGFGRLADLYLGYEQIILFDYSRTLLQDAVAEWGHDPRFVFVAGNIYSLPFATASIDTLAMVRVMHHLAEVPNALQHIERVLHSDSTAVLEYANKRNLKAMLRWATRGQSWSPFDQEPVEFVELNYDFHPDWMNERFEEADLTRVQQYGVSHFRLPMLKRTLGANVLSKLDSLLFASGGKLPIAPSIFVKLKSTKSTDHQASAAVDDLSTLLRCPYCVAEAGLEIAEESCTCNSCNRSYPFVNGIWDFKPAL